MPNTWQVPAGWRDVKPTRWRVEFDRVGRNHHIPPLELPDADHAVLGDVITQYALQGLASRDVLVSIDWETLCGTITCGFSNGGSFRLVDERPPLLEASHA